MIHSLPIISAKLGSFLIGYALDSCSLECISRIYDYAKVCYHYDAIGCIRSCHQVKKIKWETAKLVSILNFQDLILKASISALTAYSIASISLPLLFDSPLFPLHEYLALGMLAKAIFSFISWIFSYKMASQKWSIKEALIAIPLNNQEEKKLGIVRPLINKKRVEEQPKPQLPKNSNILAVTAKHCYYGSKADVFTSFFGKTERTILDLEMAR